MSALNENNKTEAAKDAPDFNRVWEGFGVSATSSFEYLKNARIRTNTPSELRAPIFRVPREAHETLGVT